MDRQAVGSSCEAVAAGRRTRMIRVLITITLLIPLISTALHTDSQTDLAEKPWL